MFHSWKIQIEVFSIHFQGLFSERWTIQTVNLCREHVEDSDLVLAQGQQDLVYTVNQAHLNYPIKKGWIFLPPCRSCFGINIKSQWGAVNTELPWRAAAERWLWSCWWVMRIWTSGWGRRGICGCRWAGCAGRRRSRCELCPSAPSAGTPVPKQDYTHKKIPERLHPSFHHPHERFT